MATFNFVGAWAPNGSTNQRMQVRVRGTVSEPTAGATSVTVSGAVYLGAGYSFYHNGALFNRWGSLIGGTVENDSINVNVPTNGEQQIFSFSRSAGIGASPSSLSFGFSVRGISYVGSSTIANVGGNIPLPARTSFPTPTGVSLSWPSNASSNMTLSWGGGPVHLIRWRRRSVIGSSAAPWEEFQDYSSVENASPYAVTALGGYYEYQMAVRRGTGAAASAWAYSNVVRQFLQPNTPTNIGVTRQSDSRHTVTWSYVDTWDRPAQYFSINRYSTKYGSWVRIAAPARGARSWVDTSDYWDDYIGYRVIAVNAWNEIESTGSAYARTTPEAAATVVATRTGPAAALLTWTNRATAASNIDIQFQASANLGASWTGWANLSGHTGITPVAQSRALSSLNAALWYRFRVATNALNNPGIPNLVAYSAQSDIIRPAAAPNPPTVLAPSGINATSTDLVFRWRHNSTDGSEQTAAELQWWPLADPLDVSSASAASAQEFALGELLMPATGAYALRVRTKGQHASWSGWSPAGSFELLDPPTATITSPPAVSPSNRATLVWEYADVTGSAQTVWRADLLDASGEPIEQASRRSNTERTITFHAHLDNLTTYQARLWVTSGTGITSEPATVTWTTDFLPPVTPGLDAAWLESEGLVRLVVANAPTYDLGDGAYWLPGVDHVGDGEYAVDGGVTHLGDGMYEFAQATVAPVYNRIERSLDLGETWVVLADDMPLNVGFGDTLVPLHAIVWYRAVAVGELGTEAATDPPIEVRTPSSRVWLTGEDGATLMVLANPQLSVDDGHERVSETYYGRSKPTAHYGEGRPVTVGVSGDLLNGMGYGQEVGPLLAQDVFYRDPYGRAFWASVADGFARGYDASGHNRESISFAVEQVHVEG